MRRESRTLDRAQRHQAQRNQRLQRHPAAQCLTPLPGGDVAWHAHGLRRLRHVARRGLQHRFFQLFRWQVDQ